MCVYNVKRYYIIISSSAKTDIIIIIIRLSVIRVHARLDGNKNRRNIMLASCSRRKSITYRAISN